MVSIINNKLITNVDCCYIYKLINSETAGPISMKFFGGASGWPASDPVRFGGDRKLKKNLNFDCQ